MKAITILCLLSVAQVVRAEPAEFHIALQGQWSGTAIDGTKVSYSFTKEGNVTWHVDDDNFTQAFPKGLVAKYKISIAKPYWKLDIHKFEHPMFKDIEFRGILEVLSEKSFRMEGAPSNRGERPERFTKDSVLFQAAKD
jgi:hypothetical protein